MEFSRSQKLIFPSDDINIRIIWERGSLIVPTWTQFITKSLRHTKKSWRILPGDNLSRAPHSQWGSIFRLQSQERFPIDFFKASVFTRLIKESYIYLVFFPRNISRKLSKCLKYCRERELKCRIDFQRLSGSFRIGKHAYLLNIANEEVGNFCNSWTIRSMRRRNTGSIVLGPKITQEEDVYSFT
jgi:hypothetical protein